LAIEFQITAFDQKITSCVQADRNAVSLTNVEVD